MSFSPPTPGRHLPPAPRPEGPLMWGAGTALALSAATFLITIHWVHILDALPYLLVPLFLALCMFGQGGHGGQCGHSGHGVPAAGRKEAGMSDDYGYGLNAAVFDIRRKGSSPRF